MGLIRVDVDVDLHYETVGRGPTLVLVNGLSQTTSNWMAHVRSLSAHFRVVTFDWRGQGKTPVGARELSPEVFSADLLALLDEVSADRALVCGFSYGARIALHFAATHPDRVERLVLTGLGALTTASGRMIVRSWRECLRTGGLEAMAWCSLPHIFGSAFLDAHEGLAAGMVRASVLRNDPNAIARALDALSGFDEPMADASRFHGPTLVIAGEHDPLVRPRSARALAESASNGVAQIVADAGHTVALEQPGLWRELLRRWCSEGLVGMAPVGPHEGGELS